MGDFDGAELQEDNAPVVSQAARTGALEQQRNGKGSFTRTLDQAERDAEAVRLRSRGWQVRDIAKHFGVSIPTASGMISRALKDAVRPAADEYIGQELFNLDVLAEKLITVIENCDEIALRVQAVAQLRQVHESRRKLLGLDAATKVDLGGSVNYTYKAVDVDAV